MQSHRQGGRFVSNATIKEALLVALRQDAEMWLTFHVQKLQNGQLMTIIFKQDVHDINQQTSYSNCNVLSL